MAISDDLGPGDQSVMDTPEELFKRYERPVVAFFLRRGFSLEDSRDLAQDTFLRVFRHIDGFRGESSVETWLFQVASNLYKNKLRSLQAQKRDAQEVSLDKEQVADAVQDNRGGALEGMLKGERAKKVHEAMQEMPPQMRLALSLRLREMKYRDIADAMNVSIETVKAHLYQARQHLRSRLGDYFTDSEF